MRRATSLPPIASLLALLACACGSRTDERVETLHAMPALWESEIVVADPRVPDMLTVCPMKDRHDPSLIEALADDVRKTEDYIPEPVMAYTLDLEDGRKATLAIGDRVEVLAQGKNNTKTPVCLVRTRHKTYAWLYIYHLQDSVGGRLAGLP